MVRPKGIVKCWTSRFLFDKIVCGFDKGTRLSIPLNMNIRQNKKRLSKDT